MNKLLYRVFINNLFEWETTQKILFKLGYKWNGGDAVIFNFYDFPNNIGVWESKYISNNIGVWESKYISYNGDGVMITFEEFITKIESEVLLWT